jgi:hypothetical protein
MKALFNQEATGKLEHLRGDQEEEANKVKEDEP